MSDTETAPPEQTTGDPAWTVFVVAQRLATQPALAGAPGHDLLDMATYWAPPLFALRHAAPEVWESDKPTRVVIGGYAKVLTDMGGRGLSLVARAMELPRSVSLTIWCDAALPPARNIRREFLLVPPTKVVRKRWHHALDPKQPAVDVLILMATPILSDIARFVDQLGQAPAAATTLLGVPTRLHAVLLRKRLVMAGYTVAELHEFGYDGGPPTTHEGMLWFKVSLRREDLRTLGDEERHDWDAAFRGVENGLPDLDPSESAAFCERYGRIFRLRPGDDELVLHTGANDGVSLKTGQYFFALDDYGADVVSVDFEDEYPFDESVLETLRDIGQGRERAGGMSGHEAAHFEVLCLLGTIRGTDELDPDIELGQQDTAALVTSIEPEAAALAPMPTPALLPPARPARLNRAAGTTEVLALAAMLGGAHAPVTLEQASSRVVDWLSGKGFHGLATNTSEQVSTPDGEVTVETDEATVWAVRFDDRRQMAEGAIWRVEMTLVALPQACALGVRLSQLRSTASAPDPTSGVPAAVVSMSREFGLWDGGTRLEPAVTEIRGHVDFNWLQATLFDPGRALAMVVVSNRSGDADASLTKLASRLLGLAHVVVIGPAVARQLSELLPARYPVYGNAIRVYRPRPGHGDNPLDHPLWTSYSGLALAPALANQIAEAVSAISLEHESLDERAPPFRVVRQQLTASRLATLQQRTSRLASTVEEERARHEAIVQQLEKSRSDQAARIAELEAEVRGLQEEITALRQERDAALDDVRAIRHQASQAWTGLPRAEDQHEAETGSEPEIPDVWDGLEDWVEQHCAGRLVLLPSAAKACRESPFEDVPLAYRSLLLLANEYVDMRRRGPDEDGRKAAFEAARLELGLDCSPVGNAKDSHQFKADYRKTFEGRQIVLDLHLKRGKGYDERTIFRVYFAYDEESQRVIVGHMPSHLTNRKTRNA